VQIPHSEIIGSKDRSRIVCRTYITS